MSVSKGFGAAVVWLRVDAQPIFLTKGNTRESNGVLTLFNEIDPPQDISKDKAAPFVKPVKVKNSTIERDFSNALSTRRLSVTLTTYLLNLDSQWAKSLSSQFKVGSLGYEIFLLLMQLNSINPTRPIPMKHILHGGRHSARRISDFLKMLAKEGYIHIRQLDRGDHLSRERYLEVSSKLTRIFNQITLDIQGLVESKSEGGGTSEV